MRCNSTYGPSIGIVAEWADGVEQRRGQLGECPHCPVELCEGLSDVADGESGVDATKSSLGCLGIVVQNPYL
jgi:hypothetical protein